MQKLKVMTIVGTRPEIIRLSEIIRRCDRYFDHYLVHTGQNYDYNLNEVFFKDLNVRAPDEYLGVAGENLGRTMGNVLAKAYDVLERVRPDALLVLGDTNSCLSVIPAKRLKIPVFHMEAGNRCFDENLPEEINRRIVDHTSDINLCYSEHARRYLLAEGLRKEHVFAVGSPMAEVLSKHLDRINASAILDTLGLRKGRYILLSAHREENIDIEKNFFGLMGAVNALAAYYDMPVIYSVHPRSAKFIAARSFQFHANVRQLQPFGFLDYNHLQQSAFCVVSDSGTLPEESAFFRFPAASIRTSTERPEALDKGGFVIGGISKQSLLQAVQLAVDMDATGELWSPVPDYTDLNVSAKVVKLIQSYVPVVNRTVWRR